MYMSINVEYVSDGRKNKSFLQNIIAWSKFDVSIDKFNSFWISEYLYSSSFSVSFLDVILFFFLLYYVMLYYLIIKILNILEKCFKIEFNIKNSFVKY